MQRLRDIKNKFLANEARLLRNDLPRLGGNWACSFFLCSLLLPFRNQPFRSWPSAVAVTPDGAKLYVSLPGREGYPDFRVAVVNTTSKTVTRWIDLRPSGQTRATRPLGLRVSPVNTAISARPYVVVLNEYGNFASVIDTGNDTVTSTFETDFVLRKVEKPVVRASQGGWTVGQYVEAFDGKTWYGARVLEVEAPRQAP